MAARRKVKKAVKKSAEAVAVEIKWAKGALDKIEKQAADAMWNAGRPAISEEFPASKEFVGWIALGVDSRGENRVATDARGADWAIGELFSAFDDADDSYGCGCIVPSSVRVFRIGDPVAWTVGTASSSDYKLGIVNPEGE